MTNEEKGLLIAYLVDAGEVDPDGDLEEQFMAWFQDRQPDARRGPLQGYVLRWRTIMYPVA